MENQSSLKSLYLQSEKERDSQEMEFELKSAELKLEADILATQQSIQSSKVNLARRTLDKPFNPTGIIQAKQDLEGFQNGLLELKLLKSELFPS